MLIDKKEKIIHAINDDKLLFSSMVFACIYWSTCESHTSFSLPAKVTSTLLLTLYRHQKREAHQSHALTVSLAFHSLGDLLIELSEKTFVLSLATFFIGHAFYAWQMTHTTIQRTELSSTRVTAIIALGSYIAYIAHLLVSNTDGVVQKAIPAYCLALFSILALAILQKEKPLTAFSAAFSYALADKLIAIDKFIIQIPRVGYVTWASYFGGQVAAVKRADTAMIIPNESSHMIELVSPSANK